MKLRTVSLFSLVVRYGRRQNGQNVLSHQNSLINPKENNSYALFDLFITNHDESKFSFRNTNHEDEFCIEKSQFDFIHDEIKIIPHNESQEIGGIL